MTVGWIEEGNKEAKLEATGEPIPPLSPFNEYPCPFCCQVYKNANERQYHIASKHRVDTPVLYINGREPDAATVVRVPLSVIEIEVQYTKEIFLSEDGKDAMQLNANALAKNLGAFQNNEIVVKLSNDNSAVNYTFSFRIAEENELVDVETAYYEIIANSLSSTTVTKFLEDQRTQGVARDYAEGIASYCLGVLSKSGEMDTSSSLPIDSYREYFNSALEKLSAWDRVLSRLMVSIVRFQNNDFSNWNKRTYYQALDYVNAILNNPEIDLTKFNNYENTNVTPKCPVDRITLKIIELSDFLIKQEKWEACLGLKCDDLLNDEVHEPNDVLKVLALWAAIAWRLNAKEQAVEPLRRLAASYPFKVWAEKYLAKIHK